MRRWSRVLSSLFLFGVAIQLIPYGRQHENPPVIQEPQWHDAQTQAWFEQSCADCHSNRTRWPWYAWVAPASWIIQHHVDEGRAELNLSSLGVQKNNLAEMGKVTWEGSMPPELYLLAHPEARLSKSEIPEFIHGLELTFTPLEHR
jgi:hypothetical protein